jgi:flagellar motility protein MotE (MotC chaperone)
LVPKTGQKVDVQAGSDILLRLPAKADAELSLQGCDDESIRVDLPGINPVETGMFRKLTLGSGSAKINLVAGSEVIVTSREEEWENMAEFDPLGREGPFSPGEFPGISSDMHERISRRIEEATRRALKASVRTQEQSERVQRRVEAAMRRAEEKMRSAERRTMHMGISVGRWGVNINRPVPPVPPTPPAPPSEPVTDEERLTILKLLQEKKISLQEAEKLLAALEGR